MVVKPATPPRVNYGFARPTAKFRLSLPTLPCFN